MNKTEMDRMQDEISSAIWNVIKKEADKCATFHWDVTFKDKKEKLITFEEGDIE